MVTETTLPGTVDEFDAWVSLNPERHFEFINGEVIEKMATTHDHGRIVMKLCSHITLHLDQNNLPGYTTGETSGFRIKGERCIPDCAYIANAESTPEPYREIAPELVIEVVSNPRNDDELRALRNKRELFLGIGAVVWEVYPEDKLVDVYTPDGRYYTERITLRFDRLPGLEITLARIF